MDWLIITIVVLGLGLIGYIYYQNQRFRRIEQDKTLKDRQALSKLELERLKKERQEKQKVEKERATEVEALNNLRREIDPVLQRFLTEHEWLPWIEHMQDVENLLKGQIITVQELLQHNSTRRFPDDTLYKIGYIKQMPEGEYFIPPEKVEALQEYFICFLELISQLKSRGISINNLQLHRMLQDELIKKIPDNSQGISTKVGFR